MLPAGESAWRGAGPREVAYTRSTQPPPRVLRSPTDAVVADTKATPSDAVVCIDSMHMWIWRSAKGYMYMPINVYAVEHELM